MGLQNYQELIAWQREMDLVERIYSVTRAFPKEEIFTLTSQLRRAAISIPSNIAEGQGRGTNAEFVRFLRIAYGSFREVETHIVIARRLQYISEEEEADVMTMAAEIGRLINGLIRAKQNG